LGRMSRMLKKSGGVLEIIIQTYQISVKIL
jgi:hypothetical protein